MWQFLAKRLLASLERKAKQKAVSKIANKSSSSFLNLVKGKPQEVDLLFNRKMKIDTLKRVLRKPNLWEQWKKLTKKGSLKRAFKSWDYIKKHFKETWRTFKSQGSILTESKASAPIMEARGIEKRVIRKLNTSNNKQVSDSSVLNSSWLYHGTWISYTAQGEDYWLGTLYLTTKIEKEGGRITTLGKTYSYPNFPLTVLSLNSPSNSH